METSEYSLIMEKAYKYADVLLVENRGNTVIVRAKTGYIPKKDFQEIFESLIPVVKKNNVTKVIFDKSELTVFHQPSMEWYFTEWKEKMFALGVFTHRKILPKDRIFIESARIARGKLEKKYPDAKFHLMDIKYCENIDEAIEK